MLFTRLKREDVNRAEEKSGKPMRLAAVGLVLMALFLAGCQVDLYQGLTEKQANVMLSTLLKRGIQARKVAAGKTGFKITVDDSQMIQSLEILRENGLPDESFDNLGKVFSGQGMISSPSEEQARLSYAISQELADTFSRIDGVLTSRVHIVLASTDPATDVRTPPSAAVFLRHTPDSQVTNLIPKIREVTSRAVPGLDYEKISVMLVPVRESHTVPMQSRKTFWGLDLDAESGSPYLILGAGLMALAALGGLIALGVGFLLRRRRKSAFDTKNSK